MNVALKNPLDNEAATIARPNGTATTSQSRLIAAMEEVMEAMAAGQPYDRDALLSKYHDVATELADCLGNLDFIQNVAPQLADEAAAHHPTSNVQHPTPSPGLLGDFRIVREIGRGGMGVVYEAEQISIGRRVALKVLPFAAMLDRQQLNRFKNEARAAGTLDHPNIVAVYSVGVERGVHYYAMHLVEGQSLAEVIAAQRRQHLPLPPGEGRGEGALESAIRNPGYPLRAEIPSPQSPAPSPSADTAAVAHAPTLPAPSSSLPAYSSRDYYRTIAQLGIQAAEALDHAHQNGILHRDIKPANLLIESNSPSPLRGGLGRGVDAETHLKLWITDFGLARIEQDAGMTMTGDLLGTLRYMSPEQALAKRVVVDHRSDIYSLGVTLYELLTLQPAFTGDDRQELLRQIAFEEPCKPRQINARIPRDLETIVLKAIEKNPAQRYTTASALAADLRCYLENQPIKAKPLGWRGRAVKWARRHPAGMRATAATSVAILILLTAGLGWIARDRAARKSAIEQEIRLALDESITWQEANLIDNALSSVKRAESLITMSDGDEVIRSTIRQRRRDLEVVRELESVEEERGGINEDWQTFADERYGAAFRNYGIDLAALSAEEAAERIRASPIREELITALDDWCQAAVADFSIMDYSALAGTTQLQIAVLVDADPWRGQLRRAIQARDETKLLALYHDDQWTRESPRTALLLARCLSALKHLPEATDLLERLHRKYPSDFCVNTELALAMRRQTPRKDSHALAYRTAAVALRPNSAYAHNSLSVSLKAVGDIKGAETELLEAIRLQPKYANALHNLVILYNEQDRRDDAYALIQETLKPKDGKDYVNLAGMLATLDQAGAEAASREAIRLAPKDRMAHYYLGASLYAQRRFAEAEAAVREALQLDPDFGPGNCLLGGVLRKQGRLDEAAAAYRTAIEIDGEDYQAHWNLGAIYGNRGKFVEAETAYRAAVLLRPNSANLECEFANILRNLKKFDEAATLLQNWLPPKSPQTRNAAEKDKIQARAYFALGLVRMDEENYSAAAEALRECVRLDDKHAMAHLFLGWAYANQGNSREAESEIRKAIELKPEDPAFGLQVAGIQVQRGRYAEAAALYEEFLARSPDSSALAANGLAWLLATCPSDEVRDGQRAVELATRACEAQEFNDASSLDTIAAAYAEAGDFESARRWATKAIELTTDESIRKEFEKRLRAFQAGKPWRESYDLAESSDTPAPAD